MCSRTSDSGPLADPTRPTFKDIQELSAQLHALTVPLLENARRIQEVLAPTIRRLINMARKAHEQYRTVRPYLADRGWFLGGWFPLGDYAGLAKLVQQGHHREIELFMIERARSRVDVVQREVCSHWPERRQILQDAFEAHQGERYTLSIPAMLAQADGIFFELLGEGLWKQNPKNKRTALDRYLDQYKALGETIPLVASYEMLLEPATTASSISEHTKHRDTQRQTNPAYGPLNRHGVLHGIDLDYPTEANGLRAIVILDYLVEVKQILSSHAEHAKEWEKLTKDLR